MKKDFLTITPESGGRGSTDVTAVADPNVSFKERQTSLNFSATGGQTKVEIASQLGVPFFIQAGGSFYLKNSSTLQTIGELLGRDIYPTGGFQSCPKIIGSILFNRISAEETQFNGNFVASVLSSLVEGKQLMIDSKFWIGDVIDHNEMNVFSAGQKINGYTIFDYDTNLVYIQNYTNWVVSIGISTDGSVIQTYLAQYEFSFNGS